MDTLKLSRESNFQISFNSKNISWFPLSQAKSKNMKLLNYLILKLKPNCCAVLRFLPTKSTTMKSLFINSLTIAILLFITAVNK